MKAGSTLAASIAEAERSPTCINVRYSGAGEVYVSRGADGATGSLIGVRHRRADQQLTQPGQESFLPPPRRAAGHQLRRSTSRVASFSSDARGFWRRAFRDDFIG